MNVAVSPVVWVVIVLLILTNALYVAAEFGAVGVRRSRVQRMSDDGHRSARRLLPRRKSASLYRAWSSGPTRKPPSPSPSRP